jgi:hypothetical protein
MCSDPDPAKTIRFLESQGAIIATNPGRPQFAGLFKPKRWVARIFLEKGEVLVSENPNTVG